MADQTTETASLIEPSNAERADWLDATTDYVAGLEAALQSSETEIARLTEDRDKWKADAKHYMAAMGRGDAERADELQGVVAALYRAWPDAEDIASDWPNGVIGSIEQIIAEKQRAEAGLAEALVSVREINRLFLVIESAVRNADRGNYDAVLDVLKANSALVSRLSHSGSITEKDGVRTSEKRPAGPSDCADHQSPLSDGWETFERLPDVGRKFIALYSDGSGAAMFWRHRCGYIDADGQDYECPKWESYDRWAYLPDLEFYCENCPEDPMTLRLHSDLTAAAPQSDDGGAV